MKRPLSKRELRNLEVKFEQIEQNVKALILKFKTMGKETKNPNIQELTEAKKQLEKTITDVTEAFMHKHGLRPEQIEIFGKKDIAVPFGILYNGDNSPKIVVDVTIKL